MERWKAAKYVQFLIMFSVFTKFFFFFIGMENLEPEDRDRYHIQDNVLTIKFVDPERDPGMFQCRAENHLKIRYSSAQLRVLCKFN